MVSRRDLYMQACHQSKELYAMTEEESIKLKAHIRKMYLEIEKVCDRHNLRMCTGYGTVLGAKRHGGFIPWDDDMDLLMPREDYDKLVHQYANELPENLKIYAPNTELGPIYRFAKVVDTNTRFILPGVPDDEAHGVFIDIFPLEYAPKCKWGLKWRNTYTKMLLLLGSCVDQYTGGSELSKRLMCSSPQGARLYKIRQVIGWFYSWRNSTQWNNRIANYTHYKKNTGIVNVPTDGGLVKSLIPHELDSYFPAVKMKFDDIEVYVPNDTEAYLVNNYGDWTWVPPVEERWQHFIEKLEL